MRIYAELRPNTASVIWDMTDYQWNDDEWIEREESGKRPPEGLADVDL